MFTKNISKTARIDGILVLCIYLISPLLVLGWLLFIFAYFLGIVPGTSSILGFLIIVAFSGGGNFTIFYEIATAIYLDHLRGVEGNRIRLLPLIYMHFFVSMFAITIAFLEQITVDRFKKELHWERTHHPSRKMLP